MFSACLCLRCENRCPDARCASSTFQEEVRNYQKKLASFERRMYLESEQVIKWKGKVAKLKEKLSAIPKGTKQLARAPRDGRFGPSHSAKLFLQ